MRLFGLKQIFLVIFLGGLTISGLVFYLFFQSQETTTEEPLPCTPTPKNVLEASQLKPISVSAYSTLLSATITSNRDIGYIFSAYAGQKIKYNKLDDICVWIFAPNNRIITDLTFPIDGKYIMQIASLKKSVDFDIYISLEVDPNLKQKIEENILKSSASLKYYPKLKSSNKKIFTELISRHFSNLNNQNYKQAWLDLSPNFQETVRDSASYGSIWKPLNHIDILELKVVSQTPKTASIHIQIDYSITSTAAGIIKLIFDPKTSRWLIDEVEISSDTDN